ncbi:ASB3-like protein [Mya arenaria]|uniref:ASB3-like protein n=1 Tax=Mya arenaria TaxID=6604 RepID=A0ABY7FRV5_MYAAR|nr:ASB3-like protein [Mya arenaria]
MNFEEAYPDTIGSVALAARAGRPADVKDNRGWIAVHEAAYFGHDKCLNQLLQRNIAFATAETFESQTPLHLACSRGHAACVKILLQTGADPNAETKENYTPLWHAVSCNIDCVKLLVDAGALVNHQIYTKETALHRAVNKGKTDIVCYLIGQNADITLRDENGLTPLFISAQMGRLGCVEALVNKAKEKGNKFLKKLCCMLGKYPSFIEDWLEYHQIVDCTNKWAVAKTEIMLAGLLKYYKPEPCDDCKDNKYDFCVENIDLRLSDEDSNHDLEYFRNPLITGAQYDDEPVYENHEELLAPLMELKHLSRRAVVLNMMHRGTFTQTGIESLDIPVHMKEYISLTDIDHPIQNLHLRASKEAHRIEKEIDQFLEQEDKDGVIPRSPVEYEGNPTANIKHKQDIFYMESVVKNFLQDPTMFAWVPDQSMIEEDMYVANDNEDS